MASKHLIRDSDFAFAGLEQGDYTSSCPIAPKYILPEPFLYSEDHSTGLTIECIACYTIRPLDHVITWQRLTSIDAVTKTDFFVIQRGRRKYDRQKGAILSSRINIS
ncbi:hypothetical protein AB1N83_006456 [Pleurotus pulmonarius]